MARHIKQEVCAVNLRISNEEKRNYARLLKKLFDLRRGFKVHGDTYVAIQHFDERTGFGTFSKYTEIEIDGEWFDLEIFDAATPEKLDKINIPENLRPNLTKFYFQLGINLHVVAFSSYTDSKNLSPKAIEKYFRSGVVVPEIFHDFGRVDVDVVQDYDDVLSLLMRDGIREIDISIKRPNPDDIGDDLAKIIEERLKGQNAEEYVESLKTSSEKGIQVNERTRNLAIVGAENGSVRVKSPVNGVMKWQDTSNTPLTEVEKYAPDESEYNVFSRLVRRIFQRIREMRQELQAGAAQDPEERA